MKTTDLYKILLVAAFVALSLPQFAAAQTHSPAVAEELARLDDLLERAQEHSDRHEVRVRTIENMLHSRGVSLVQQYNIYSLLYDEYYAFQFDKAVQLLDKQDDIAARIGDVSLIDDLLLKRAMLYTSSGMFLEAKELLEGGGIDTLRLAPHQRTSYYNVQQRFYRDFNDYSQTSESKQNAEQKISYYRSLILRSEPSSSPLCQYLTVLNAMDGGEYDRALQLNTQLLSHLNPSEHDYAIHAYHQARIFEALNRTDDMIVWFARSAAADAMSATKDNASLCSLAQEMLKHDDIDHAFRYISLSLSDALFYNAKLRPWQIAYILPVIERAYQQTRDIQQNNERELLVIISLLALVLALSCGLVIILLRRSRRAGHQMELLNGRIREYNSSLSEKNEQLNRLNNNLMEANSVKEEYITLFLAMCSDNIEKLNSYQRNVRRKLSAGKIAELKAEIAANRIERELDIFYKTFDDTFLQLYPSFVEEFNALLKPESRIELKHDERLNTELRIFALIRLGISNSSRIASLLRYSVNTIYNYRTRIKNAAVGNREEFEEQVRNIGLWGSGSAAAARVRMRAERSEKHDAKRENHRQNDTRNERA